MHVLTGGRAARLLILIFTAYFVLPAPAHAQRTSSPAASSAGGIVEGTVTTQNQTIPLGGAVVSLTDGAAEVGRVFSNGDGTFKFENVPPGQYKVMVSIQGFDPFTVPVGGSSGETTTVP